MSYEFAMELRKYGFSVVPIWPGTKKPKITGWTTKILSEDEIREYFDAGNDVNIAVALGSPSNGIVDIDIDCDHAALLASQIVPETGMVFGRESRPATHYIYRVEDAKNLEDYVHPDSNKTIIELRGNKHYTVFPTSIHESGEIVRFEKGKAIDPSVSSWNTLSVTCKYVAVATVISDYWKEKNRHKLALSFSGLCASNNISKADCKMIIGAICSILNDDEVENRLECVDDTYNKYDSGDKVLGITKLNEILSEKASRKVRDWMGIPARPVATVSSANITRMSDDLTTDHLAAKAFADVVTGVLLYSEKHGRFYRRINNVYEPIGKAQAMQLVIDFVNDRCEEPKSYEDRQIQKGLQSLSRMNAILELSKSNLDADSKKFDTDRMLVGCSNGVLDIKIRQLVDPATVVTKRVGTAFDPSATCPRFEAFIAKIMGHDAELIAYLKRAVGYSLSGLVDQQCMFVCIGSGANGKSTFQNVIQSLLGDYAASTPMHALMATKNGNDKTDDLAALPGKRFVSAQEGESSQSLAVAKIKMMTGGDKISCRALYGHLFEYYPDFKLWLFTNELPKIPGGDGALWRRVHIVPFDVTIPPHERNPKLGIQLIDELPGILIWALDGFAEFEELGGLKSPASVVDTTSGYREDSDVVQQFVNACCDQTGDPTDVTMNSYLYAAYEKWCYNCATDPVTNVVFGKDLGRLGFSLKRTSRGNGRRGILLKSDK